MMLERIRTFSSLEKQFFGDLIPRSEKHTQKLSSRITDLMDMSLSKLREMVMDTEAGRATLHGGRKESDTAERLNHNTSG